MHDPELVKRFWSKVERVEDEDSCWLWTDKAHATGYGRLSAGRGSLHYSHRLSKEIELGRELEPDEHVDHLCRVRLCVRPDHLEVVTVDENTRRQWIANPPSDTCPQGHSDWGRRWQKRSSTYVRRCKECHRQKERARRG